MLKSIQIFTSLRKLNYSISKEETMNSQSQSLQKCLVPALQQKKG